MSMITHNLLRRPEGLDQSCAGRGTFFLSFS
jgi:hypothetical protein